MRRRIAAVIMAAMSLSGCGAGRYTGGSYASGDMPEGCTAAIAEDATAYLVSAYPPGHTSVSLLSGNRQPGDAFAPELETRLRQQGFSLAASGGDVSINYILDNLRAPDSPRTAYLRLRIADKSGQRTLTRPYGADCRPVAGFSVSEE